MRTVILWMKKKVLKFYITTEISLKYFNERVFISENRLKIDDMLDFCIFKIQINGIIYILKMYDCDIFKIFQAFFSNS